MAITPEERDSINALVDESRETEEIARKLHEHLSHKGTNGKANGHHHSTERLHALLAEIPPLLGVEADR